MAKSFDKLTRPNMRKLAVGQKINENGISFERLADGDGVFTINVMVDGQRIHRVIGKESDGTTCTQVEEFIAKVRTDDATKAKGLRYSRNPLSLLLITGGPPVSRTRHQRIMSPLL